MYVSTDINVDEKKKWIHVPVVYQVVYMTSLKKNRQRCRQRSFRMET